MIRVLAQFLLLRVLFMSLGLVVLESILWVGVYSLLVSLCVCLLVRATMRSWFGAIAIVVYVGGLLVIFSYFLAICPNQAVKVDIIVPILLIVVCIGFGVVAEVSYLPSRGGPMGSVSVFYLGIDGRLLLFLGVILLLTLVRVVKVVEMGHGPLRVFGAVKV